MKKGIIVTVCILGALAAFGVWVMSKVNTDAQIAIIGPGQPVTFRIDGGPEQTVGAKARVLVKVTPGAHEVEVLSPSPLKHSVTVAENRRMVVPVLNTQCFGKMDFFLSHYVSQSKRPPSLKEVLEHSAPFELPKSTALHPNELPGNVERGPVWLLRSASCAQLATVMKAQKRLNAKKRAR